MIYDSLFSEKLFSATPILHRKTSSISALSRGVVVPKVGGMITHSSEEQYEN